MANIVAANRRNRPVFQLLAPTICLFQCLFCTAPTAADDLARYEASHRAMGSQFTIVLYAPNDEVARAGFEAAFRRIVALDKALSDYDPRSELSRLSAASPTEAPVSVSDDLWQVMEESARFHEISRGHFDVTVGPLTTLWRQSRRSKMLPTDDQLRSALSAVGFQHVQLDKSAQAISLQRPGMRLDLGGIAKGYAVDAALMALRKHKIDCALVNGGGDIAAGAAPPGREGWKVGIAPLASGAKPSIFLLLENLCLQPDKLLLDLSITFFVHLRRRLQHSDALT